MWTLQGEEGALVLIGRFPKDLIKKISTKSI
jgi:hypothetical protein